MSLRLDGTIYSFPVFNPLFNMEAGIILLPYWFSLNNSEAVKVVTLAFLSIQ